jgi:hypothetical protein
MLEARMTKAIRWTPTQLAAYDKKKAASAVQTRMQRFQALGRLPKGSMNKTEAAYAELLEQQKRSGQIVDFKFHPMNIRLADRTFYEVDFLVLHADMTLAIHETKGGFTTDKGQMKIKVCAESMPWFRFLKCIKQPAKNGGGWKIEEFNE